MNKLLSLSIPKQVCLRLVQTQFSHFWACKVTTFFWNSNDLQHFFSKKLHFPLFYWHFKNMLYNIFSSKPPISPPKTPSKPYLFNPLSASFGVKSLFYSEKIHFRHINILRSQTCIQQISSHSTPFL